MKPFNQRVLGILFLSAFMFLGFSTSSVAAQTKSAPPPTTSSQPAEPAVKAKVKQGETKSNCDVTVAVKPTSGGTATINPGDASGKCDSTNSTVDTTGTFDGTISGLDPGDTVNLGASSTATVTGTGGTVNMKTNSTGTFTNTGTAPMTVNTGGGNYTTVPGGATNVVVHTGS